jgi:hypothetical protein
MPVIAQAESTGEAPKPVIFFLTGIRRNRKFSKMNAPVTVTLKLYFRSRNIIMAVLLFVTQGINGIQPGRFPGRIIAEYYPNRDGNGESHQDCPD